MTALLPLTQVARLMGCPPETALELAQARRLHFERIERRLCRPLGLGRMARCCAPCAPEWRCLR
jgi:hypothetical protein